MPCGKRSQCDRDSSNSSAFYNAAYFCRMQMRSAAFRSAERNAAMSEYLGGVDAQALTMTLDQLVRNVGELLPVPSVSVALLDSESGDLVTWAALCAGPQGPKRTRFRTNEGIAGWVAAHLEPVSVSDVTRDARFKPLRNSIIRSMLCVPSIDQPQPLHPLPLPNH